MNGIQEKTAVSQVNDVDQQPNKTENELNVFYISLPESGSGKDVVPDPINLQPTKVYRRRWLMLLIFVFVSMSNAFQWIQFSIITSLLIK